MQEVDAFDELPPLEPTLSPLSLEVRSELLYITAVLSVSVCCSFAWPQLCFSSSKMISSSLECGAPAVKPKTKTELTR